MDACPPNWFFVRGIHRSPVNSPHKGQWRGDLIFSLICAWTNGWVNNRDTGDLRRHRAYYDVTVMMTSFNGASNHPQHDRMRHILFKINTNKTLKTSHNWFFIMEIHRWSLDSLTLVQPSGTVPCHGIIINRFYRHIGILEYSVSSDVNSD